MAITVKTCYTTGQTLYGVLKRASDGHTWDNVEEHWAESVPGGAGRFELSESASPFLGLYTGSPTGDLGSPGYIEIYIVAPSGEDYEVQGLSNTTYVLNNEEVRPLWNADGSVGGEVDLSEVTDAIAALDTLVDGIPALVDVELADDFAAIPAATEAEIAEKHGVGNYVSEMGAGSDPITLSISSDGSPVEGASVWVTSDVAGTTLVRGRISTDSLGAVHCMLTDGQPYFLWATCPGYNDITGEEFTASQTNGNEFEMTEVVSPEVPGTSVYDLISLVDPYVVACPANIEKEALRDGAIEFFERTELFQETQTVTMVADTPGEDEQVVGDTITLSSDYASYLRRVLSVKINDSDSLDQDSYEVNSDGTVTFDEDLALADVVKIEKVLIPTSFCYIYPSELLTRWARGIVCAALFKLYAMKNKPWSDKDSAAEAYDRFMDHVTRARREKLDERETNVAMNVPKVE